MALKRQFVNVLYDDGRTERYPVTPIVEITFERTYGAPVNSKTFEGPKGSTLTYQLGWEAMRKAKSEEVIPAFEAWVNTLVAMDVDVEEVAPFVAGAAAGSSPSSPSPPE